MYCVFADIGQSTDFPAQGILEHVVHGHDPATAVDMFVLRWIERINLSTSYEAQVLRFKYLMNLPKMRGQIITAIDGGGVGRSVLEIFKQHGIYPKPICFIGSQHEEGTNDIGITVPKYELIQGLMIEMDAERFRVAKGLPRDTDDALKKEMRDLTMKVNTRTKNVSIEAKHEKIHDDMVMAIALGLFWLKKNIERVEDARDDEQPEAKTYDELRYGFETR